MEEGSPAAYRVWQQQQLVLQGQDSAAKTLHGRVAQFPHHCWPVGNQGRCSGDTVVSRHEAKGPDNGMDCKVWPGAGTKLTLSWVTEDGQSGLELASNGDEMGSC